MAVQHHNTHIYRMIPTNFNVENQNIYHTYANLLLLFHHHHHHRSLSLYLILSVCTFISFCSCWNFVCYVFFSIHNLQNSVYIFIHRQFRLSEPFLCDRLRTLILLFSSLYLDFSSFPILFDNGFIREIGTFSVIFCIQ